VADAPGRVNLIGEHTDYNSGLVLPIAVPQRTRVELTPRTGSLARVASAWAAAGVEEFEVGRESRRGSWLDYVQGAVVALSAAGFTLSGFDARITSELPVGSGLSSSAALEVSLLRALRAAFDLSLLDDLAIARIAQRAENEFVGAPVGIMDPMASSLGDESTALFVDTQTLHFERVRLPPGIELVVIDSGVTHSHATGEYSLRRDECFRAARLLGVPDLRAVGDPAMVKSLPPPLDRRARHVVSENARVLAAVKAMEAGEVHRLGMLFDASHASLRDDFEVTTPDTDRLARLARSDEDVFGARMTGGGFGGAIVAIAREGTARAAALRTRDRYNDVRGPRARILLPRPE
jgi:galactokinase